MSRGTVLVTGGAGFIGSHTVVDLLESGFKCVVVDNFVNAHPEVYNRIKTISGNDFIGLKLDLVTELEALDKLFAEHAFDYVIHFAGLKAVGESSRKPLLYHKNNLISTLNLLEVMQKYNVKKFIFSSSATVYGDAEVFPVTEASPLKRPTNPYGRTKFFIEEIIRDIVASDPSWTCVILRYFNPVGAHSSGLIGEDPAGIPNNLMPYVSQVAVGRLPQVTVFGNDYNTPDGTGVRDYIHVVDLARGHVAALNKLPQLSGEIVYNLGTGRGYSVLEMVAAMSKASGSDIPYVIGPRRAGDVAIILADPARAQQELGWSADRGLDEMCRDSWKWQTQNPKGFADTSN